MSRKDSRPPAARRLALATWIGCLAAVVFLWTAGLGLGWQRSSSASKGPIVAARVNGHRIYRTEVVQELERATSGQKIDSRKLPLLQATMLQQLINRRLVLQYLSRTRQGASRQDIDFELERLREKTTQRGSTLDAYLIRQGLDAEGLRQRLAWQLGWPRFLKQHVGDEELERFFQLHRRDYDGTKMRVSHILLRVPRGGDTLDESTALDAALARAQEIRRQIEAGKLTFADAARKYSQAPTADRGGDLGFISRYEPMPEAFSRAAFDLKSEETSRPIVTHFGVHLVHCCEVTPGERNWRDVQDRLRKDGARLVFQRLASAARRTAQVEYSGAMPYLDPVSRQLVSGNKSD